jgi:hypothetical protein
VAPARHRKADGHRAQRGKRDTGDGLIEVGVV